MITRDPSAASSQHHDLIVIGGGIHGACIALEAVKRGLRPLLLERDDFGGATSWNSQRIVHGGLRYLQTLDVRRHLESVRERRWFLRAFPHLVRPLPCLMPLYENGRLLQKPAALRAALLFNDFLSCRRNAGVRRDRRLGPGRIIGAIDARLRFPLVRRDRLCAAVLWHDALMLSPQRIIIEILRAACAAGATALNYVEATELIAPKKKKIEGVAAVDRATHDVLEFHAPIIVNAAGPWCRALAQRFDSASARCRDLFRPSLAYVLVLDRPPVSECAVAVSSGRPDPHIYFLSAAAGLLMAGTQHAPALEWDGHSPRPTPEQIQHTLDQLNAAVPALDLTARDVLRVHCGLLPAHADGSETPTTRPIICDHGNSGGQHGLYSVSGVKFTTARLVAERAIARLAAKRGKRLHATESDFKPNHDSPPSGNRQSAIGNRLVAPLFPFAHCRLPPSEHERSGEVLDLIGADDLLHGDHDRMRSALERLISEESVLTLDDLLLRRTNWLDDPRREPAVRARLGELLNGCFETHPPCRRVSASRPMEARMRSAILNFDSAS